MTTRLSQRKIKGGDPAYPTLKEELQARTLGGVGGSYTAPAGGIPRADMTQDVQSALSLAEAAYVIPSLGIPTEDLDANVRSALVKAISAYQKPTDGIILTDLESSLQTRLTDFSNFYIYPITGIPYVDLDIHIQGLLDQASTAYQKPVDGIGLSDIRQSIKDSLLKADTAYQKPATGIPLSDIDASLASSAEVQAHINNNAMHITDHTKLSNIGSYTHSEIDNSLDEQESLLTDIRRELSDARDTYMSIGARIDASIGKNTLYTINTKEEWLEGISDGLIATDEDKLVFKYESEPLILNLYDISDRESFIVENKVGGIMLTSESYINNGTNPWVENRTNYIGLQLQAYVYAPVSGTYRFGFQFSGRAKMQVAGQLLFSSYDAYSVINDYTRFDEIELEGGRLYPIILEGSYYNYGTRIFGLYWKPPGQSADTFIPMTMLNQSSYRDLKVGTWESPIIDLKDNEISTWYTTIDSTEYRVDDDITLEICTSSDGLTFSSWLSTPANGEIPITPERFLKIKATIRKDYEHYTPILHSISIRYISAGNNEYIYELINARDTYLELKDRFESIENQLINLSDLYDRTFETGVHPEQFMSVRLSEIELNLLRYFIREAEVKTDYIPIEDGFVDHFKTLNFIDMSRSENIELNGHAIRQKTNLTTFSLNNDWAKFTINKLTYTGNALQLGYKVGSGVSATTFSNWYNWSWANPIGQSWYKMMAQPFYTQADTGTLTSLLLQVGTYGGSYPKQDVMIVPTKANGEPDVANPLYISDMGRPTGQVNLTGLRIPVLPNTKYWIVIRMTVNYDNNGYTYWYITPNNGNTSSRLRGSNPESATLFYWGTNDGVNWSNNGNYFLSFQLGETGAYESDGTAEYIQDYIKPTQFITATTSILNPTSGSVLIKYQSSDDQIIWSQEEIDVALVPAKRFLKIKIRILQGGTALTPSLKKLELSYVGKSIDIISKPFDTRHVPTHSLFVANSNKDSVTYFISRDDGKMWRPIQPFTYQDLSLIAPGLKVRLKAVFDGGIADTELDYWGVLNVVYRDITGQNIVASQQEFIAEQGQTDFSLEHSYPMGNHALQVYLNGVYQSIEKDYVEVDSSTVRFTESLEGGLDADRVTFRVAAGAYDEHDLDLVQRIEDLELLHTDERMDYDIIYAYDDQNRVISETYDGLYYHTVAYQYDAQNRKEFIIEVRDTKMTTTQYIYDDQNRIQKKIVTHSEVTA